MIEKYIARIRNLEQVLNRGLHFQKIHRVIKLIK